MCLCDLSLPLPASFSLPFPIVLFLSISNLSCLLFYLRILTCTSQGDEPQLLRYDNSTHSFDLHVSRLSRVFWPFRLSCSTIKSRKPGFSHHCTTRSYTYLGGNSSISCLLLDLEKSANPGLTYKYCLGSNANISCVPSIPTTYL